MADDTDATVHLVDWETGEVANEWTDPAVAGTPPHIKALHPLGVQAGFIVAHSGGVVAIDPSGNLLFERFSEAPWVPIDVRFDGTTCIVWERNEATTTTGCGRGISKRAVPDPSWRWPTPRRMGRGRAARRGTPGNVCMLHESDGLTLVNTATGGLSICAPCWGRAPWAWRRMARWGSTAVKRCSCAGVPVPAIHGTCGIGKSMARGGQCTPSVPSPRVGLSSAVSFRAASNCGAGRPPEPYPNWSQSSLE